MARVNPQITKTLGGLILAAKDHTDALIAAKIVSPEHLKYIFADRQARAKVAKKLSEDGMSTREIAALAGVGHATIARDLAVSNETKSVSNATAKLKSKSRKGKRQSPEVDDEPNDDDQTIWRRGLMFRAEAATAGAAYEDWSDFETDRELVRTVRQAAEAWKSLAVYLEELTNGKAKVA